MNTAVIVSTSTNVESYSKSVNDCLKSTSQWAETIYTNICTGQTYTVANGTLDVSLNVLIISFGVVMIGILGGMLFRVIFDF